ncbi:MAG: hypothetical protein ABIZ05_03880 [Pseudonocardiaceae bacterium]
MIRAYLVALDPTPAQAEAFRSHCGGQRYAASNGRHPDIVGPDRRTRTGPSHRWRKTTARVAALHTRMANARRDGCTN